MFSHLSTSNRLKHLLVQYTVSSNKSFRATTKACLQQAIPTCLLYMAIRSQPCITATMHMVFYPINRTPSVRAITHILHTWPMTTHSQTRHLEQVCSPGRLRSMLLAFMVALNITRAYRTMAFRLR